MSANNARIRRLVLDILWTDGPMTKEAIMDIVSEDNRLQPSNQSLGSILSKSHQIVQSGKEKVLSITGVTRYRKLFDVDRSWIHSQEELPLTYTPNMFLKQQIEKAKQCASCSRLRLLPEGSDICLFCQRRRL